MVLVIDAGNTNIKFGVFKDDNLILKFILPVNKFFLFEKRKLLKKFKKKNIKIKSIILSSVVPEVKKRLNKFFKKYFFIQPISIQKNIKLNFINKYKSKKTLGEDRIADIAGAEFLYPYQFKIIIDFGTATVLNVVNEKREFLGGAILPGFNLISDILNKRTASLPIVKFKKINNIIGKTTKGCINVGIFISGIAGIKFFIEKIKKQFKKKKINLIITGGNADLKLLKNILNEKIIYVKNLSLIGLKKIYDENKDNFLKEKS